MRYRNLSPEPNQGAEKQLQGYLQAEDFYLFADLLERNVKKKKTPKLFNQFKH